MNLPDAEPLKVIAARGRARKVLDGVCAGEGRLSSQNAKSGPRNPCGSDYAALWMPRPGRGWPLDTRAERFRQQARSPSSKGRRGDIPLPPP